MVDRRYVEITQDEYYWGKKNGAVRLVDKEFRRDHEIYHALVSFVKGKYFLSYSYEKKIKRGLGNAKERVR